jgi:hypothetical protein
MEQKKEIMDAKYTSFEKLVEIRNCRENSIANIVITDFKDKFAYKYDIKEGFFIKLEKDELIKELMEYTIKDITAIYDELENGLNDSTKNAIKKFFEEYENPYDEYIDTYNNKYPDIVSYKHHRLKILLYMNKDKITKNIRVIINKIKEIEPSEYDYLDNFDESKIESDEDIDID